MEKILLKFGECYTMAILKKSDILLGIDDPRKITIESLGGEVYLRPLSSNEVNEIVNIESRGYGLFDAKTRGKNADATAKLNLAKVNEAAAESKYQAILLSINNPKNDEWSLEELHTLHSDQIEELYENVMRISGVETTEADVKRFLED